jgi:GMP reductase
VKLSFSDVTIKPELTDVDSRSKVKVVKGNKGFHCSPVIVSNMDTCGTITMAKALYPYRVQVCLHKYYSQEQILEWFKDEYSTYSIYSMGISNNDLDKFEDTQNKLPNLWKILSVRLDVANGYMRKFHEFIKIFKDKYPCINVLAGNVCTPEGCEAIIKAGADGVVCGIGNGSLCLTSNKAGIGIPQMSVCIECGQACHELGKVMVSDGGVKQICDIPKALTRADYVMCGGLFMGYDECEGEWKHKTETRWITTRNSVGMIESKEIPVLTDEREALYCYGMSSKAANDKYNGGMKEYRTSEGKENWIPYKGKVETLIKDINGSLTSACAYTNCFSVDGLFGKELIEL